MVGPAGLTAGLYAARANLEPLILEGPTPGGQLISTTDVENWPGEKKIPGIQLIKNLKEHALHFGCTFIPESAKKIDTSTRPFILTTDKDQQFSAQAIITSTGATPKRLGCHGEQEYWAKGVSVCAVCDGTFYKNRAVVVVGGGDTAMENASFLTNFTDNVTIVHIMDKLTASAPMQKRVLDNPKIKIIYGNAVSEIRGNRQHVQEVIITDQTTKESRSLKTEGVFVSIGFRPDTDFLKGTIDLDKWGYISVWENKKLGHTNTSVDGIFAAGDAVDYLYRQAITASGSGCMAALDAERYLEKLASEVKG